jgi:hypothetical protein
VNEHDCHKILWDTHKHRWEPYKDIAEHVGGVTADQVWRTANDADCHCRVVIQKPFLTKVAVKKRIKWAEKNQTCNWDTVAWTDKSTIELGTRPGHQFVTWLLGEEYLPKCIQPTFHNGRKSIMVWAAISHGWKGPIISLNMSQEETDEGTKSGKKGGRGLNGSKYVSQMLKGPLKDFVKELEAERGHNILVVEDGAPGHTNKLASKAQLELGLKKTHPSTKITGYKSY